MNSMESNRQCSLADPLREELRAFYERLDAAIAHADPKCVLSGRCCRFVEFDHRLYLTQIEADYLCALAPPPVRPLDQGESCPWQDDRGRCTAREARPLGCRVFHCAPDDYEERGQAITERFLAELSRIAEQAGVPRNYETLHAHLARAQQEGRIEFPTTGEGGSTPTAALTP